MPFHAGVRLGPYEIATPVGAGGMGEVYRARDTRLDRTVAIKVLNAADAGGPLGLERFRREARAISRLSHPHICALHDVGEENGVAFLVMEHLEGETLANRLESGPLPLELGLRYAHQVAMALDEAHRQGVVHRDLKPANIMLTRAGVKVLDFGLAKLREPEGDERSQAATRSDTLTAEGTLLGTVPYMAPEQLEGRPTDARTDVFAFGAVVYEMLTGMRPFKGNSRASLIAAIMTSEPELLSVVRPLAPPLLDRVVRRCLAKDPDERWQSARDLAAELLFILESGSQAGLPAPEARRRRVRLLLAGGLLGAAVAAVVAAAVVARRREAPAPSYRQVTFRRGTIHAARFAPDGHTVVYGAAFEGAPTRVFTTRIEGPAFSPLALPNANLLAVSASGELALALSYDYVHNRGSGALARAPLAGGAPRDILERVEAADWAPNEAGLAVVRSAAGVQSRLEFPIGRVLFETRGWISHPRVSPRGDSVAFLHHPNPDQSGSVAVVDTSGKLRTLAEGFTSAYGLAWGPSGREVWFTAARRGIHNSLRAVSLDGRERTVFAAPARLILHDVSPDGRTLFARESMRGEIAGKGPSEARERPLHWLDFSILNDLSADGSQLLLTEGGETAPIDFELYLRKLDDSPAVHLGQGFAGSLSPDGKWVLANEPSGPERLVLLPTGVGEESTVQRHGIESYRWARWFPDGKRIVFDGTEPGRGLRLYVQSLGGGVPRAVTPEGVRLGWLKNPVSPDGRWVTAFGADGVISLYPVEGGDPQPLPALGSEDRLVRWVEYGRSAYVWRPSERPTPIYRLDLSNGRRTLVTRVFPADSAGVGGLLALAITSDAQAYAYGYVRELAELYLAQGLR